VNSSIRAAIAAIPGAAWKGIRYPRAIFDDQLDCWVSDAEVAETGYTAFTSKKNQQVTARLIVRRVRDLNKKAAQGQDELFPVWRYHAVFTDSPFELAQAKGQHRGHAVVEQVFADWYDGPLAHLPSGHFNANAAWLVIAAMAQNLLRTAGVLAGLPTRRPAPRPSAVTSSLLPPAPPATAEIHPAELGVGEIASWHRMRRATPSLAHRFLSPEFAMAVGRFRPSSRAAILMDGQHTIGFFPFERRRFGLGVPISGWLSACQGVIHEPGAQWEAGELLSGAGCRLGG
jgi:hypothetical protein